MSLLNFIGSRCPFCNKPMYQPTRDHLYPQSRGGGNRRKNILIVRYPCNQKKGSMPMVAFLNDLETKGDPRARHVRKTMEFYKLSFRGDGLDLTVPPQSSCHGNDGAMK